MNISMLHDKILDLLFKIGAMGQAVCEDIKQRKIYSDEFLTVTRIEQ